MGPGNNKALYFKHMNVKWLKDRQKKKSRAANMNIDKKDHKINKKTSNNTP